MPLETAHPLGFALFSRDTNYTYFLSLCLSIVPAAGNPLLSPHLLNPLGNSISLATPWHHTGVRDAPKGPPHAGSANQSNKGVWGLAL